MSDAYSRVTVVGSRRRIDLVLPTDQCVGTMTGDLISLLDEPAASPPLHRYLVTTGGEVLGGNTTLGSAHITDGAILRLVGEEGLPPAPVVYDVAEEAATDRDGRPWLFVTAHRQVLAGVVFTVTVLAMSMLAQSAGFLPDAPPLLAAILAATGVLAGRLRRIPLSAALLVTGALIGAQFVAFAEPTLAWPPWQRWTTSALIITSTPLLFALAGRRPRGALLGSAVAGGLLLLWAGGYLLEVPAQRTAAVLAVVTVAVLGFLPRAALTLSGVASLDDRRTAGQNTTRRDVRAALSSAHEGLLLAAVATATSAAAAGVVLSTDLTSWSVPLGCLLAFVLCSRARMFPLTLQVVALAGTGVVVALAFAHTWASDPAAASPAAPLATLAGIATLSILAVTLSPTEHTQARLRIILDRLEMLAVIAMIPLVVGIFGTYTRLLTIF